MKNKKSIYRNLVAVLFTIAFLYSCASIGRPEGGPLDEAPPVFLGSTPDMGATNVNKTKITLHFDEFIKLENTAEKVVISPPQLQQPIIRPIGKRVVVSLEDSLKANTTYTIDFGDAIIDNNEGNPLGDFTFTFSTGDVIDTLAMSGVVLNANDLEPIKNILVGLHGNLNDSAFMKEPFIRVARTDSRGLYTIHGIAPGKYKIYALQDADQNYMFSQKNERIAFMDSVYIPTIEERIKQDTIWKDTLTIDTIYDRTYTHFLPDDIVLRAFKEDFYNQYLVKHERTIENKLTLYFSEYPKEQPEIKGINFDTSTLVPDYNLKGDTIYNYWIKDSLVFAKDTLFAQLNYQYTDTLNELVAKTDTLRFTFKHKKEDDKRKKKEEEEEKEAKTVFLPMNSDISSNLNVYDIITLAFDQPIETFDESKIHLSIKKDTLWNELSDIEFKQDSTNIKAYSLFNSWTPGASYKFTVDSLAFKSIYGLETDGYEQEFSVKKLNEYGTVLFNVSGYDTNLAAFIELLDDKDNVIRTLDVNNATANFYYLDPGKYGARIIIDWNRNGKWDTGNYEEGLQPEPVYYYPQFIEFKANWTTNQDWNVTETPLPKQKLNDLKKQKPDEEKKKKSRNNRR